MTDAADLKKRQPPQSQKLGPQFSRQLLHFQDQQGAVIEGMGAAGEGVNLFQDFVGDSISVESVVYRDQVGQAGVAKEFSCGILRVADAVRVKYHDVALVQDVTPLVVS